MLLYNLTFPKENVCSEQELYFRGGSFEGNLLRLKSGEKVSFDTYFNSFSHSKYKKYTSVKIAEVRFSVRGKGVCRLKRFFATGEEILTEKEFSGNFSIFADLDSVCDGGFLYPEIEAFGETEIYGGGYYSDASSSPVKIGIAICTFMRENYVKRNVAAMEEYFEKGGKDRFGLFIVDNGRTLPADLSRYATVIPNENSGGSGGFTRGIKEVVGRGEYTHFLLMDDDIVLDCEVLERTANLISCLKEEYRSACVGGGMLVAETPCRQHELGAFWTGVKLGSYMSGTDVRYREILFLNESSYRPDYNAWWYMCMPCDTVRKYGLPLPMFIKCDDVEYGLRAAEEIIVTNGIAVWHDSFDLKYSPEGEYYVKRNEFIVNLLYPRRKGTFALWVKLLKSVAKQTVFQRYFAAELEFLAYEDVLKGPEFYFGLDGAEYHKKLRSLCPQFLDEKEIYERYGIKTDFEALRAAPLQKGKHLRQILTWNGYFLPKFLYKKEAGFADMERCKAINCYARKKVVQYSFIKNKGFVSEIKKSAPFVYGWRLFIMFFKLLFTRISLRKRYLQAFTDYCSRTSKL